jgi:site-specific recombinase XerD
MSLFCLDNLFADFIKEKTFLNDLSHHTLRSYRVSFDKFKKYASELTKPELNKFVIGMREEGLKSGGCNVKIRSINSFLSWCFENEHISEHLKIKVIKAGQPVLKVFSDAHIKALLKFTPRGACQHRLWAITCLLIDTGARISEILELKTSDVVVNLI